MLVGELDLLARDGTRLRLHHFKLSRTPCARILVIHGRGEHGGRYRALGTALGEREIEVLALDLRGFGASSAVGHRRGAIRHFEEYLVDIDAALAHMSRTTSAQTPLFLLGHSAGGLAVVRYLQTRPECADTLGGVVLSSPFLELPRPLSPLARGALALLSALAPHARLRGDGAPLTRDEAAWRAYCEDPLTVRSSTARWASEVLRHQALARAQVASLRVPLLLLQGGADTATSPAASRRFAESCLAQYREYPGCLHEVLNERPLERERVLSDLVTWIAAHNAHPARQRGAQA
jgi:lysophospholipase